MKNTTNIKVDDAISNYFRKKFWDADRMHEQADKDWHDAPSNTFEKAEKVNKYEQAYGYRKAILDIMKELGISING